MEDNKLDIYDKICRDRFAQIEKKIDKIEILITNDIPHKIDNMMWKVIGVFSPFVLGILWILIRHVMLE